LYLNGQLESSKATTLLNTALDANGLTIGLRPGTSVWNGQLDEIDIFNRALSLAEIQSIYYAGAMGKCAPALSLTGAVSRKLHTGVASFDVPLPLSGKAGLESRVGSAPGNHTLVFTFTHSVASGSASLTSGAGTVNGTPTFAGNTMTVQLTGVTNAQQIAVTLAGVTDALGQVLPNTVVPMRVLLGDVNADSAVNSGDAFLTRNYSGQVAPPNNFRADVNTDGTVNSGDALLVRGASGTAIP
jgi:hypothetical protein